MKRILAFVLIAGSLFAQNPNPDKLIKEVKDKFSRVKDYSADANIKLDIPFFKMPDRNVKIYFKQPDKTHIESKEFTVLPKMGLNLNPIDAIAGDFAAVYLRQDIVDGKKIEVINLTPKSDTAKVRYVKLWIDSQEKLIRRFEISFINSSNAKADLFYGSQIKTGLPDKIVFQMDFGNVRLPGGMNPLQRRKEDKKETKENKENSGTVTVTYSNYRINGGIDDKIFADKKK